MQISKAGKEDIEISLKSLEKTKEIIYYTIQFADAVQREIIRPEHFEKHLIVPEPHSEAGFLIELDWQKHATIFKTTAEDCQIHSISHAIVVCKESYAKVLWVTEEENPNLYAAQMILKLLRDVFCHMVAKSKEFAAPYWDINQQYRRVFRLEKLRIYFNAENLHGKQFKFSHLGGITNLLRILNYLIEDLSERNTKFTDKSPSNGLPQ